MSINININIKIALVLVASFCLSLVNARATYCKNEPGSSGWPSKSQWDALNSTVSGKLIHDIQPAKVCYPGPDYDSKACAEVEKSYTNSTYIAQTAIGLCYPPDISPCPPVANESKAGTCSIGTAPRYTINATSSDDLAKGIAFAKKHNIRLVIRNTGHDILERSTGYGSLQVWMRYVRTGIQHQQQYRPSDSCSKSTWNGSAITIGGGYVWGDVYHVATAHNQIVVGGGDPSVGCIGGWMQGGGHSPAAQQFGLGADQVLEAEVVLQDGSTVTANECQNPDLFFAIRGGGPGTYGVVTSTTVKVHPESNVAVQKVQFAPLSKSKKDMTAFMDAVADVYSSYPKLSENDFSGYGSWSIASPSPIVGNSTVGFSHTIARFGSSANDARRRTKFLVNGLKKYDGTSLSVSATYEHFSSFRNYYQSESGVQQPVGSSGAVGSRFLDRPALLNNRTALKNMLDTTAGKPSEYAQTSIVFVGGGAIAQQPPDSNGVNPAWRTAIVHNIVSEGWAPGADRKTVDSVHHDLTYNKVDAMRTLAPHTGSYMNEADKEDPLYIRDFYGKHADKLQAIKDKYDPAKTFYCPTCIGSNEWELSHGGRKLCFKGSSNRQSTI